MLTDDILKHDFLLKCRTLFSSQKLTTLISVLLMP